MRRLKSLVRRELLAREYGPGDRFLSNNEFARRFCVSPLTANRIISGLAEEGLLERQRGRGTFVTEKVLLLDGAERGDLAATVGVVTFEDPHSLDGSGGAPGGRSWHHPFRVLQAIDLAIAEAGGRAVLMNLFPDTEVSRSAASRIAGSHVSALLVVSRLEQLSEGSLTALRATGRPFVVVGCHTDLEVDSVAYDDRGIGFAAVEHLAGLGHERIAFVTFEEPHVWAEERRLGFLEALSRRGIAEESCPCIRLPQDQHALASEHLLGPLEGPLRDVTGVVCVNDAVAVALLGAARRLEVQVPERLSITGVDDLAQNRALELTTFQQPGHELGRTAVRVLLRRLEDPSSPPLRERVRCPLIPRGTTGRAPRTAFSSPKSRATGAPRTADRSGLATPARCRGRAGREGPRG